jgi:hypothetical protein
MEKNSNEDLVNELSSNVTSSVTGDATPQLNEEEKIKSKTTATNNCTTKTKTYKEYNFS